jgi:hypothetical protein
LRVREHQLYTVKRSVWKKLKRDNIIDPVYAFRARKIEWASLALSIVTGLQRILFSRRIKKVSFSNHPPVFILGMWRSGTTYLHYMMSKDPQFGYLKNHQAFTFNFSLLSFDRLNKILNVFVPKRRPQDNVRLTLDDPAEEEQPFSTLTTRSSIHSFFFPRNQEYFRKYHLFEGISEEEKVKWKEEYLFLLKNISVYSKKKKLLLKNPHNTGRVKELLQLFPDAKFIFIHRDPYTVYRSTKKLYMQMIGSQFLQFLSQKEIEKLIVDNNACILKKYLAERELIPHGNLVEIGFDHLEAAPLLTVKAVYDRLGIDGYKEAEPTISAYLDSVKGYKKNKFKPPGGKLKERIDTEWKLWFETFGY